MKVARITTRSDEAWMLQLARNVSDCGDAALLLLRRGDVTTENGRYAMDAGGPLATISRNDVAKEIVGREHANGCIGR